MFALRDLWLSITFTVHCCKTSLAVHWLKCGWVLDAVQWKVSRSNSTSGAPRLTAAYSVMQCVTRYVALYYVALHCKRRRVANDKCRELTVQLFGRGALPPTATTTITTVHHNLTILRDSKWKYFFTCFFLVHIVHFHDRVLYVSSQQYWVQVFLKIINNNWRLKNYWKHCSCELVVSCLLFWVLYECVVH